MEYCLFQGRIIDMIVYGVGMDWAAIGWPLVL